MLHALTGFSVRNSWDTTAERHTGSMNPLPIFIQTNNLERLEWSVPRLTRHSTRLSLLSPLALDRAMFHHGLLTRRPLAHVFVAVLSSGTEHLVRFTLGHFNYIKLRPGTKSDGRYADQIRLETDANLTHVEEWLRHVVVDWDDGWISLT